MDFLNGKKTYIAAFSVILAVLAETFLGVDLPQFQPDGNVVEYIMAMVIAITMRAGVAKSGVS